MSSNLTNLDVGTNVQFAPVWLGPSQGWQLLPVVPELDVTSAAPLTIPAYASRVLLKAAVKAIALPSVRQWIIPNLPLTNVTALDRSISIKDFVGAASVAAPVVITPNGTDTVDGRASYSIITSYQILDRTRSSLTIADGGWAELEKSND